MMHHVGHYQRHLQRQNRGSDLMNWNVQCGLIALEQPASYRTQISCSNTLEPINFSALNRFRLKAG